MNIYQEMLSENYMFWNNCAVKKQNVRLKRPVGQWKHNTIVLSSVGITTCGVISKEHVVCCYSFQNGSFIGEIFCNKIVFFAFSQFRELRENYKFFTEMVLPHNTATEGKRIWTLRCPTEVLQDTHRLVTAVLSGFDTSRYLFMQSYQI